MGPVLRTVAVLLLAATLSFAQQAEEAQVVTEVFEVGSSTTDDDTGIAMAIDEDVGMFVVGTTEGTMIDASVGGLDFVLYSLDREDAMDVLDASKFGGDGDDVAYAVAINTLNARVVVVGSTISETVHLFDKDTATGEVDFFIASFAPADLSTPEASYVNGTTFENQFATAVAVDSNGDYIVGGYSWGNQFGTNAGDGNSEETVGFDAIVFKVDMDVTGLVWEDRGIQFGTVGYDTISGLVLDEDDNIYVVGNTNDTASVSTVALQPIFVRKFDPDGEEIWTVEFGEEGDGSTAYGITMSADQSEVYISGHTRGALLDWDEELTGVEELFLFSLAASDGEEMWVYQSQGNSSSWGEAGVVLAEDGSPIIGGYTFGNHFNLTSPEYYIFGEADMIAAKIDPDTQEVLKYFVGSPVSNLTSERAFSMVSDPSTEDGVYLLGYADGSFLDLDLHIGEQDILAIRAELDELPETEEEEEEGDKIDYWIIGVGLVVVSGVLFVLAYKWSAYSLAVKQDALKNPKV